MKKFALAFAAAIAAAVVTLVLAPTATAYPDVRIDLSVNRQVVYGGDSFTATVTANVTCNWSVAWNNVTRHNTGSTYVTTYVAPRVTRITRIPLDSTCAYTASANGGTTARAAAPVSTVSRRVVITVLPRTSAAAGPKASGSLPNTGGPSESVLFVGLVLVVAGAGAVIVARRRAEDADLYGQTG